MRRSVIVLYFYTMHVYVCIHLPRMYLRGVEGVGADLEELQEGRAVPQRHVAQGHPEVALVGRASKFIVCLYIEISPHDFTFTFGALLASTDRHRPNPPTHRCSASAAASVCAAARGESGKRRSLLLRITSPVAAAPREARWLCGVVWKCESRGHVMCTRKQTDAISVVSSSSHL